jgi:hypothetical protein
MNVRCAKYKRKTNHDLFMAVIDERHGLRLRHSRLVQGPTLQRWLSAIAFQKAEKRERARELSSSPAVWQPSSLFFSPRCSGSLAALLPIPYAAAAWWRCSFFFVPLRLGGLGLFI